MSVMASQITSLTIVYSTVYSGADQRKYQSSASLAFVRGIHRWPVNSPHEGPVTRKMFPFDDVIMKMSVVKHTDLKLVSYRSCRSMQVFRHASIGLRWIYHIYCSSSMKAIQHNPILGYVVLMKVIKKINGNFKLHNLIQHCCQEAKTYLTCVERISHTSRKPSVQVCSISFIYSFCLEMPIWTCWKIYLRQCPTTW